jgi:hypothetical protein
MIEARRVFVASRPAGDPETSNFRIERDSALDNGNHKLEHAPEVTVTR